MDRRVPKGGDAQSHRKDFIQSPTFWAVMWFVTKQAAGAIVSFLTVKAFTPVWKKIVEKWNLRKQKEIEEYPKVPVDSTKE